MTKVAGTSNPSPRKQDTAGQAESQDVSKPGNPLKFDRVELAGAFGDLGTSLPIVVAMIFINQLSPSAVFLAFGLFYLLAGVYYRLPSRHHGSGNRRFRDHFRG